MKTFTCDICGVEVEKEDDMFMVADNKSYYMSEQHVVMNNKPLSLRLLLNVKDMDNESKVQDVCRLCWSRLFKQATAGALMRINSGASTHEAHHCGK